MSPNPAAAAKMHHHKACKGKAHGSGIAKQNTKPDIAASPSPRQGSRSSETRKKDSRSSLNGRCDSEGSRKLSRNSVSSWECSDTESLNSSEHGIDGVDQTSHIIKKINQVLNGDRVEEKLQQAVNKRGGKISGRKSSCNNGDSDIGKKISRRESWAETLRGRVDTNKYKKMEAGWDDSSVIKVTKERKWYRMTADIEQRPERNCCEYRGGNTISRTNSLPKKSSPSLRKIVKRTRSSPVKTLYDVVEWEELVELAQARKANATGKGSPGRTPGYLKDLCTLLENKAPQPFKVVYVRVFWPLRGFRIL